MRSDIRSAGRTDHRRRRFSARRAIRERSAFRRQLFLELLEPRRLLTADATVAHLDALVDFYLASGDAISIDAGVSFGSLSVYEDPADPGSFLFSYDPDDSFSGTDSFDYTLTVAEEDFSYTFTIEVTNDPPQAYGTDGEPFQVIQTEILAEAALLANDPDGDPLTFSLISGVAHGVLTLNFDPSSPSDPAGWTFEYDPDDEFAGTDSFQFLVNDGADDSNVATIEIHVLGPPAISLNPLAAIDEGGTITLTGTVTGSADEIEIDYGDGTVEIYSGPFSGPFSFTHEYLDDDPSDSPSDAYSISAVATDWESGLSGSGATTVVVNNVAPTVTIDSTASQDELISNERIDEGESFVVYGTVTDPGRADTHIVIVKVDLNFDGDTDDPGEEVEANVVQDSADPTVWRFDAAFGPVLDDGPSGVFGNGTAQDSLTINVEVADDDTGISSASGSTDVHNIPAFGGGDPVVAFTYDSDGNVTGLTVDRDFEDPGVNDWHNISLNAADGSFTDQELAAGALSYSLAHSFAQPKPLADVLPIVIEAEDDDSSNSGLFTVVADEFTVNIGESVSGNVFDNDVNPGDQPLAAVFVGELDPDVGEFTLNRDGSFTFDHKFGFFPFIIDLPIAVFWDPGTTVQIPNIQTPGGPRAAFIVGNLRITVLAPLVGHELAQATFNVRTPGASAVDVTNERLVNPAENPQDPGDDNFVLTRWFRPFQQIAASTANATFASTFSMFNQGAVNGTIAAQAHNITSVGATTQTPQAESLISVNMTAGAPEGFATSSAAYLVGPDEIPGTPLEIAINLEFNAGAAPGVFPLGDPVDRIFNQVVIQNLNGTTQPPSRDITPHWVYAEVNTSGVPGTGTFFYAVYDQSPLTGLGEWNWVFHVDQPDGADLDTFGGSASFPFGQSIQTVAGVQAGQTVYVFSGAGWDIVISSQLVNLDVAARNATAPGAPGAFGPVPPPPGEGEAMLAHWGELLAQRDAAVASGHFAADVLIKSPRPQPPTTAFGAGRPLAGSPAPRKIDLAEFEWLFATENDWRYRGGAEAESWEDLLAPGARYLNESEAI